ncbi:MAG: leucyl aminopeptidase family protein, partial [Acetobacteraceae bacterium]|nr:leucyl aminopeptidase family protein [Acetobacteraceae bacterium]
MSNPNVALNQVSLPLHAVQAADLAVFLSVLNAQTAAFLRASGFTAKPGELALLPGSAGLAGAVIGVGAEASPWHYGAAPFALPAESLWHLGQGVTDTANAVLGWHLGAYRWTKHKKPNRAPAQLVTPPGSDEALMLAQAICNARDLINAPATDLGPQQLAEA